MRKATGKWIGALLLATVLFYWKLILTNQFSILTAGEGVNQAYSWLQFIIKSIRQGSLPIWDTFTFAGHSFIGEMQTGAFYPVHWLLALIPFDRDGVLAPQVYNFFFVFSHFLGACFFFALAREIGRSRFASFISGLCFSFAGFTGRLPWPHMLESATWLPLILLCLVRALKEPKARRAAVYAVLGGLAFGMSILAGGLHIVIMQGIVVLSAAAFSAWHEYRRDSTLSDRSSTIVRAAWLTGIVVAVAGAAGAVQLLPSAEYSPLALRWLGSRALSASQKIPYAYMNDENSPQSLVSTLFSFAFYGNTGKGEAWVAYMGVFPLLLVVIGIWKNRSNFWVQYAAGLSLFAFLYSLGSSTPLNGLLYSLVPGLSLAREASRFVYLTCFGMAVLMAFGTDSLLSIGGERFEWEPLNRILRWVVIICAMLLVIPGFIGHVEMNPWNALSILLVFLSYALFRGIAAGNTGGFVRFLMVTLILLDAGAFDWSIRSKTDADNTKTDYRQELMSCRLVAGFLKSLPGMFRVDLAFDAPPNIGDVFDVPELEGAGVTMVSDYAAIRGNSELLNDEYVLKPAASADPNPIYKDLWWKVYKNPKAFPRVWLVHNTVVQPENAQVFTRLNDPSVDLHRTAFVNSAPNEPLDAEDSPANEQAVVSNYKPNSYSVSATTQGRALLVMSETYYPGWQATVNGKAAKIYKVDGDLRGVIVPAGISRVDFRYRPRSVLIGGSLTVLAFLGALLFWSFDEWTERRRALQAAALPALRVEE
jgi:hypothetical protein